MVKDNFLAKSKDFLLFLFEGADRKYMMIYCITSKL